MALQIFPEATTSSSGSTAYAFTVPAANTTYKVTQSFPSGIYTITTSPTSSQAVVSFNDLSGPIASTTTVSGSIVYSLASPATFLYIEIDTGTNIVVSIQKTAESLSGTSLSGTLDTVTTTSTYNTTGLLYVVAIGGGGGGGSGSANTGAGGGAGGMAKYGPAVVNTATSITIGAAGIARNSLSGTDGGTTTFGAYASAPGGGAGAGPGANSGGGGAPGNASYGGTGGNRDGGTGQTTNFAAKTVKNGTNGGGGSGQDNAGTPGLGGGSGIGTGGTGGFKNGAAATTGTGYGAGGGGGGYNQAGAAGSPGVVYVLRAF